jgi:hypothetical protein
MQSIHVDSLWTEIERLATTSRNRFAAVAYFTDDEIVQFGKDDLLVVDASDNAIRAGQTSHSVLLRAFDRGAKLYCCQGLHAKVIVFDDTVVIGSANLSRSSRNNLIEAGVVTDNPASVAAARFFIEKLAKQSNQIDESFLERIGRIEVEQRRPDSTRRPGVTIESSLRNAELNTDAMPPLSGRDMYVNFSDGSEEGEGIHRSWEDARQYSFVSGGGKKRHAGQMKNLRVGDRVFVKIPHHSFVGIGIITDEACRLSEFLVRVEDAKVPILEAPIRAGMDVFENEDDPNVAEQIVRVRWIATRPKGPKGKGEKGLYFSRCTVCDPGSSEKFRKTVAHLMRDFGVTD